MTFINQQEYLKGIANIFSKQSPERLQKDQERINYLLKEISNSPTGQPLLKWAKDNNLKIFMDDTLKSAGGYYTPTSGTVILGSKQDDNYLIGVLAHEIRHAWQDYHEMIPTSFIDPKDYILQVRLIEADAFAYGELIREESRAFHINSFNNSSSGVSLEIEGFSPKRCQQLLESHPHRIQALKQLFKSFFKNDRSINFYEARSLNSCFIKLGLSDKINIDGEYKNISIPYPTIKGIDVHNLDAIHQLGKTFSNDNYLKGLSMEALSLKMLFHAVSRNSYHSLNQINAAISSQNKHGTRLKL